MSIRPQQAQLGVSIQNRCRQDAIIFSLYHNRFPKLFVLLAYESYVGEDWRFPEMLAAKIEDIR